MELASHFYINNSRADAEDAYGTVLTQRCLFFLGVLLLAF